MSPGGTIENSPAIYRWERAVDFLIPSPEGTTESVWIFCRPFGTRIDQIDAYPAMNGWAIINCP